MRGFRLGSVLGFEIRIDYSWFIIFFLILWSFTFGVFPSALPELSAGMYAAMGVTATLLFFVSLLAHEISHSLVARSKDIPVEGITLFIFGGMAHTRMEAERPGDEFAIAGVGPLASLIIAGIFYGIMGLGGTLGWPRPVIEVSRYLGVINVVLAVFNLLPGFPLDGGRLFRALVWKRTGSLHKATRWATNGGKVLGYILMGIGVLDVFMGNLLGGLWLLFIGWFVRTAAEASFRQHVLRESLEGIRAHELMSPDPDTVEVGTTLDAFVEDGILRGRHRAYPVVQDGRPVGLVTLDHIKSVSRNEWGEKTVADVMISLDESEVVGPDEPMSSVLENLGRAEGGRVLVGRSGELQGIITRSDLAHWIERAELLQRPS